MVLHEVVDGDERLVAVQILVVGEDLEEDDLEDGDGVLVVLVLGEDELKEGHGECCEVMGVDGD